MRVFQHVELFGGLLLAHLQPDCVCSGRHKQRNAVHGWSSPPALRTQRHVWRIGRRSSQFDLRAWLRSQIPPNAIDARLRFAWRTAATFLASTTTSTRTSSPSRSSSALSWRTALDHAHYFVARVADRNSRAIFLAQLGLEIEVDRGAVKWIATRSRIIRNTRRLRNRAEAVSAARGEQMRIRRQHFRGQLLQRSNVIQNPESPPVSSQRQIVKAFLHRNPIDRRMRQARLKGLPILSVVERNVERVFRAQVQQTFAHGIFSNAMRITQHAMWNSVCDRCPRLAVIRRLVNERIAIVHLMAVYGDISGPGIVVRSFNVAYRAPFQKVGNILRDISPDFSAVARDLHQPIIGARPDRARFFRRLRNRENRTRVFHADVVRS